MLIYVDCFKNELLTFSPLINKLIFININILTFYYYWFIRGDMKMIH
jgi:hypothetical protein